MLDALRRLLKDPKQEVKLRECARAFASRLDVFFARSPPRTVVTSLAAERALAAKRAPLRPLAPLEPALEAWLSFAHERGLRPWLESTGEEGGDYAQKIAAGEDRWQALQKRFAGQEDALRTRLASEAGHAAYPDEEQVVLKLFLLSRLLSYPLTLSTLVDAALEDVPLDPRGAPWSGSPLPSGAARVASTRVHVVGARAESTLPVEYWAQISSPKKRWELTMVGPGVPPIAPRLKLFGDQGESLFRCETSMYHDSRALNAEGLPRGLEAADAVVLFNPGLGATTDSWAPTLERLARLKAPVVITAFSEADYERDLNFAATEMKSKFPHKSVCELGSNPYQSLWGGVFSDLEKGIVRTNAYAWIWR